MSHQARGWVMDKSTHKGLRLFALFLVADELNARGEGSYASVSHLARLMRMRRESIQRILRDLEKSGELICVFRGTGRANTRWRIPGVVSDGYFSDSRGNARLPLGQQLDAPGATDGCPRGNPPLPNPSTGIGKHGFAPATKVSPPPKSVAVAVEMPQFSDEAHLRDLREWLTENCPGLDALGQNRLLHDCHKAAPWCQVSDIYRACSYKLAGANHAHNKAGLLISTVPAILAAWGPLAVP
jgi:hypothetical protein